MRAQLHQLRTAADHRARRAFPIAWAASNLLAGKIGAVKGLGGWHLACDAGNAAAVAELRRRKHRDEKPFAIMVRDCAAAELPCEISLEERELLTSPARPITLLASGPLPRWPTPSPRTTRGWA